jgi:hypothetical protein
MNVGSLKIPGTVKRGQVNKTKTKKKMTQQGPESW